MEKSANLKFQFTFWNPRRSILSDLYSQCSNSFHLIDSIHVNQSKYYIRIGEIYIYNKWKKKSQYGEENSLSTHNMFKWLLHLHFNIIWRKTFPRTRSRIFPDPIFSVFHFITTAVKSGLEIKVEIVELCLDFVWSRDIFKYIALNSGFELKIFNSLTCLHQLKKWKGKS